MKVVIVGGGTAGWLAAYYIQKKLKDRANITVIESSKIGIIGAGEGGTHMIGSLLHDNSIADDFDIKDFIIETEAAYKHGTKHVNWRLDSKYYYNPLDINISTDPIVEKFLARQIVKDLPVHVITDVGVMMELEKTVIYKDESGFAPINGYSYHFDGNQVGKFFKKRVAANIIDSVVQHVNIDDTGINSLILDTGETVKGDLFIDCSGFQRVLMKALNCKWVEYDNLLVNSAMPFFLPVEPPVEVLPETTAFALSSGWMWKLPINHRFGSGYVFNEDFISFEQAQKEVEDFLGHSIDPIKQIRFKSGRSENVWIKNCVSLGLASAFVEPLEATSIHATTYQIQKLVEVVDGVKTVNDYNIEVSELYDEIKEFITLHYMSGKEDTPFWKLVKKVTPTPFIKEILEISKHRFLTASDIPNRHNSISYQAWNQILAGLGMFSKDVAEKYIDELTETQYQEWYNKTVLLLDKCKSVNDILKYGKFEGTDLR